MDVYFLFSLAKIRFLLLSTSPLLEKRIINNSNTENTLHIALKDFFSSLIIAELFSGLYEMIQMWKDIVYMHINKGKVHK